MTKYFIIGLILLSVLLFACSKIRPSKEKVRASDYPVSIVIDGAEFNDIPSSLATALSDSDKGSIPPYSDIVELRTLSTKGTENPDILLALALLQAQIVESGIYIDDLRKDLDLGRKFSEDYFDLLTPDIPEKFLIVADKVDILERRVQWFEETPPR